MIASDPSRRGTDAASERFELAPAPRPLRNPQVTTEWCRTCGKFRHHRLGVCAMQPWHKGAK